MGINPEDLDTIAIPQLTEGQLSDLSLMVHSLPTGKMNRATLLALVTYLANKPLLNKISAWSASPASIGTYRSYSIDGVEYLFRNLLEGNTTAPSLTSGGIPAWTRTNQQKEIPRWSYSPFIQPFQAGEFCYLPVNSNGITHNWVWKSKVNNNDHHDPLDSGSDTYWEFIGENKFDYVSGTVYSANDVVVDTLDSDRTYISNVNNNDGPLDQNLGSTWQLIGFKDPSGQLNTLTVGLSEESQTRQNADYSLSTAITELAASTQSAIDAVSTGQINAELGVPPPPNISIANVSTAGTYTYYNGLIVSSADLAAGFVQFRKLNNIWTKVIIPIDLSNVYTKAEIQSLYGVNTTTGDYIIQDGNGKIVFWILPDGTIKMSDFDTQTINRIGKKLNIVEDSSGSFTISDSNKNICFQITADGLVSFYGLNISTLNRLKINLGVSDRIYNKKISIIGDSISTDNGGGNANLVFPQQYWGKLQTLQNCQIFRNAIGGTTIANSPTSNPFNTPARWQSLNSVFEPDVIIIEGGINDFLQDVPLGVKTDTTVVTFFGALDYLYKSLLTRYPNARIFQMTPVHTTLAQGGGLIPEFNGQNYLSEYVNAMFEVGRRYGIGLIDTNQKSGITCFNIESLSDDKIHFKDVGHTMVYRTIINELNNQL